MADDVKGFGATAEKLSRTPLGIIALFIVLIYGLAVVAFTAGEGISSAERMPVIWFMVGFPILLLAAFVFLMGYKRLQMVSRSEFTDERNYTLLLLAAAEAKQGRTIEWERLAGAVRQATAEPAPEVRAEVPPALQILWVDDNPDGNMLERQAFESIGIKISLATSSDQARGAVDHGRFDAIVSDMARPEGKDAGLSLLDELRVKGNTTPYFIYAGVESAERRQRVLAAGGQGYTTHPQDLFEMVTATVLGRA